MKQAKIREIQKNVYFIHREKKEKVKIWVFGCHIDAAR